MSMTPNRRGLLTYWRRVLFYTWVVAALIALAIAAIGGPIVSSDGADGTSLLALISPVAMFIFVASGLLWLVLLFFSHRSQHQRHPPPG